MLKGIDKGNSRRWMKALGLATAAAVLLSACGAGTGSKSTATGADATGSFDWKKYSGTSINVMMDEHPWTNGMKENLDAFTKATGITVNVASYGEDIYFDKMNQSIRTSKSPDVFMTGLDFTVATQKEAGLLESLTPYIDNPALTSPDYNLADFPNGVLAPAQFSGASGATELFGIPISTECYILFYNKDLVDKYLGGKVPTTMPELIADAQLITKAGKGEVFGSLVRGVRASGIVDTPTGMVFNEWPSTAGTIALPYNVWFDGAWNKPRLTDPAIAKGLSDYAALIAAGPPNRFSLDWPDANTLFTQGKAAFYVDASVFGPSFEDTAKSTIAGKVGYAPLPTGAVGGGTGLWSWGLGIASASKHKEAAWLFTQWFTNSDSTATIGAFTGGPPRQSAADLPAFNSKLDAGYVTAVKAAMSTARPTAVIKSDAEPILLVVVDAVIAMANGKNPTQVMKDAQSKLQSLVK
ncbi:MAG: sugar ABC transporter substrate-binding protein [Streptomycetaceae bacterium]|nr:MAG: sugar ABC transporter substrate-binding protein [Streptomycetaceae bacterium]